MAQRLNQESFDPTPEETAKAVRAKPAKIILCMKCKNLPRIEIWETARHSLDRAFLAITQVILSPRSALLTRDEMGKLRRFHELLCRASRARYCQACVTSTVEHVRGELSKMSA